MQQFLLDVFDYINGKSSSMSNCNDHSFHGENIIYPPPIHDNGIVNNYYIITLGKFYLI